MQENAGAVDVELTSDDLCEIETASSQIEAHGERYPEIAQRMINR